MNSWLLQDRISWTPRNSRPQSVTEPVFGANNARNAPVSPELTALIALRTGDGSGTGSCPIFSPLLFTAAQSSESSEQRLAVIGGDLVAVRTGPRCRQLKPPPTVAPRWLSSEYRHVRQVRAFRRNPPIHRTAAWAATAG